MDIDDPSLERPKSDMELPRRKILRSAIVLPREMKSNTENDEPSLESP
jgi:hypothetical protein